MNILLVAAALVTTNLVVFTDLHRPEGTSHLHGTRTVLTIRDGLITDCRGEGVYNLFNGLRKADARRKREADRANAAKRRGGLVSPRTPVTNAVDRVTH